MATPSLFPQFLKASVGGGGSFTRLNVDELEVEVMADYDAEVLDVIEAEVADAVIEAEVVDVIDAEVDC